jgi:hypothetical protein
MVLRGLVAVWIGVAVVSESAPVRADAAEVEALIAKGNELRRAGTPGPALPYFQKAYQLARTPRTAGQLGLAELAAGYPVEAAEHLAAALESPKDPSIVKYRQMLADALATARSQIGELAIQGSPAGAEVEVNGRVVGVLPLSSPVKLAARNTEIVVRAPGYSERRQLVPIAGGQRHDLAVNLEKVEKPTEPTPAPVVVPPPSPAPSPAAASAAPTAVVVDARPADAVDSGSGTRTAAWFVGGGALAVAGTAVVLNLASRSSLSAFNASCVNDPMGIMRIPGGQLTTDDQCRDRYDSWQSYRGWAIVGYVSAAALAVTSGVLFWISRPTSTAGTDTHARIGCGPTPNGVACQGTF